MKGSIIDMFFALIFISIIAFTFFMMAFASGQVMDAYEGLPESVVSNETKAKITTPIRSSFEVFNYGFLSVVVAIFILISALAWYSDNHPMFIPITVFVMIINVLFAIYLSNAFWEFVQSAQIWIDLANEYFIITFIMKNLPFITTAFDFFIAYIMYRNRGTGIQTQAY